MVCKECGDDVEELVTFRVGSKKLRLCEDCADRKREELDIASEAEGVMQGMMDYKGR